MVFCRSAACWLRRYLCDFPIDYRHRLSNDYRLARPNSHLFVAQVFHHRRTFVIRLSNRVAVYYGERWWQLWEDVNAAGNTANKPDLAAENDQDSSLGEEMGRPVSSGLRDGQNYEIRMQSIEPGGRHSLNQRSRSQGGGSSS